MKDFSVANIDIENLKGDIRYKGRKCGVFEVVEGNIKINLITETSKKALEEIGEPTLKDEIVSQVNNIILKSWEEKNKKEAEKENAIFAVKKDGSGVFIYLEPTDGNIKAVTEREDIERVLSVPRV